MKNTQQTGQSHSDRRLIGIGVIGFGALILVVSLVRTMMFDSPSSHTTDQAEVQTNAQQGPSVSPHGLEEISVWDKRPVAGGASPKTNASSVSVATEGSPPPEEKFILNKILSLVEHGSELTTEQVGELQELLQQLQKLGDHALPFLQSFLKSGKDIALEELDGGESLPYPSLRVALISMLVNNSSAQMLPISLEVLATSTSPHEIALLAYGIERAAPGEQRDYILQRVEEEFARLSSARGTRPDIVPLFEVFQSYGGTNEAAYIEAVAGRWSYYATLSLSQFPNGEGIPALIRLANNPEFTQRGNGDYALRPLAQVAVRYASAREALQHLAIEKRIPDTAWPAIASGLTGMNIQFGKPVLSTSLPETRWTQDQIRTQIAFIDQLLASTSSAIGKQSLQHARLILSGKLAKSDS
jgi:hypothetical protein